VPAASLTCWAVRWRSSVARRSWRTAYEQVNGVFADRIVDLAAPGSMVWLHDYQLLLAPQLLRHRRPDLRIGL